VLEDATDSLGNLLRGLDVPVAHVDHARAQLGGHAVLLPELDLVHHAVGELEHELVGVGVLQCGEVGR
jgi:hypothetical protein